MIPGISGYMPELFRDRPAEGEERTTDATSPPLPPPHGDSRGRERGRVGALVATASAPA